MAAIFISYRKEGEDKAASLHLAEDLGEYFGPEAVFLDVHGLELGRFDEQLLGEARSCQAMIVVIGPTWNVRIKELHHPQDWVRRELETGLERGILMVPLLLEQVPYPKPADLPPSLAKLLHYQTFHLHSRSRKRDVSELADDLSRKLGLRKLQQGQAAVPNLSGDWLDTDGVHVRLEQRGDTLQISMLDHAGRAFGGGSGTVTGNQIQFSLQRAGYGEGRGHAMVSPDGRQVSGSVQYGNQRYGFSIART